MPINGTLLWIWSFLVTLDVQGALVKIPQAAMRRSGAIMISAIWICQQCGLRTIKITEKQIWKDEFVESFLCLSPSLIFECGTPQTFTTTSVSLVQKKLFQGSFCCDRRQKTQVIPHRPLIWWPRLLGKMIQGWSNGCNGALVGMTSQNPGPPGSLAW